jgi:hypothetical protein
MNPWNAVGRTACGRSRADVRGVTRQIRLQVADTGNVRVAREHADLHLVDEHMHPGDIHAIGVAPVGDEGNIRPVSGRDSLYGFHIGRTRSAQPTIGPPPRTLKAMFRVAKFGTSCIWNRVPELSLERFTHISMVKSPNERSSPPGVAASAGTSTAEVPVKTKERFSG